jgi:hypothetical protein
MNQIHHHSNDKANELDGGGTPQEFQETLKQASTENHQSGLFGNLPAHHLSSV